MQARSHLLLTGLALTSLMALGGCAAGATAGAGGGGGQGNITVDFTFNEGEGLTFNVGANEPEEIRLENARFNLGEATVSSGTIEIPPEVITVELAGGAQKTSVALQAGEPLSVTVWIAGPDQIGTVCGGGEQYPPLPDTAFIVTLDENFIPTSVDPSPVALSENTVDLINAGAFTLCIRVNWSMDARVTLDSLRFQVQ